MPPEIKLTKPIPALYKRNAINLLLFGHVRAVQTNLPSISIQKAVEQFYKVYDIDEHEFPMKTATRNFQFMQQELIDLRRTKPKDE